MSQLQVTGEAKIRDIQGPVVANSGVITALDGAASQYVRGDGTLADFPTSTGGGSSVSYYLNSSVSQGTIGGVAYRQLGKTPIAGAGTDITISANGYVASYLTDANDPALLEVPAGNFNCEFYFSVNSDAHNPFVYAEVYKYDGTTFTLIGSSQSVPEYLTNGTTLSPYYFAIPVAQTVLAITDRIAIRIYVNVDGRTVTLHTENNHLCQVVTTFSKGLTSLNNLTRQVQFLATGTSGTDFGISSSVATHTFNLPVASATNTGKLSSTDWSTFNNKQPAGNYVTLDTTQTITAEKTFGTDITFNGYALMDIGVALAKTLGTPLHASTNGYANLQLVNAGSVNSLYLIDGDTLKYSKLSFNNAADYTYTFPNASGTLALTSNLSSYVPYTGATGSVNLGEFDLTSRYIFSNGSGTAAGLISMKIGNTITATSGYGTIGAASGQQFVFNSFVSGSYSKTAYFNFSSLTDNTVRSYTFPDADGTISLLERTQTFTALNSFSLAISAVGGVSFPSSVGGSNYGGITGTSTFFQIAAQNGSAILFKSSNNTNAITISTLGKVDFGSTIGNGTYTYTLPNATGTLALTSDLGAYLPLAGGTLTGALGGTSATFSGNFGVGTASPSVYTNLNTITINGTNGSVIDFKTGEVLYGELFCLANELRVDAVGASGVLKLLTNSVPRLTIASSGAATFSSSVTASSFFQANDGTRNVYLNPNADFGAGAFPTLQVVSNHALQFATNNTLRMTITSGGNVGIGTSSPSYLLDLQTTAVVGVDTYSGLQLQSSNFGYLIQGGIKQGAGGYLFFKYNNGGSFGTTMTMTNTGNVGIGTSSPTAITNYTTLDIRGTNGSLLYIGNSSAASLRFIGEGAEAYMDNISTGSLIFRTSSNERMRITSGGDLLVGISSTYTNARYQSENITGTKAAMALRAQATSGSTLVEFWNPNGQIGSIDTSGSVTTYNVTSDYRLKQDLKDYNALQLVSAIKTYDYEWKSDKSRMYGVIAHELQEVLPYAVQGKKDGEQMQGVDYSKFVPILVKAIQELKEEIEQLKNK